FWRSLRHQWLYLHELDSLATARRLVDFYVAQHNAVTPHAAFDGQTPDEVYFGRPSVASELPVRRTGARSDRLDINRPQSCEVCRPPPPDHSTAPAAP
ncbi:MAG: integrase core domain-containing protein, partial [Deltaproteobacteria bacterium]|nr:integrase core domain-containing protein [Deltaproteobacteria bacterium]